MGGMGGGLGMGMGLAVPYKYKSEPCKFYEVGQCRKGTNCTFIHGPEEAAVGAMTKPENRYKYKTEPCKFFALGKCRKDTMCPFKHGEDDIDPTAEERIGEEGAGGVALGHPM